MENFVHDGIINRKKKPQEQSKCLQYGNSYMNYGIFI